VPAPRAEAPPLAGKTASGKDLSAYMTRDLIRVIACRRTVEPTIEDLTLDYLDKSDRVRMQIEALRDMLGQGFRMKDYPPPLQRPYLAVWGNAEACVVAKKHPQGGFESVPDADLMQVIGELRQQERLFFGS
jgi:hypothetical protein